MHSLVILISVFNFQFALALQTTSALVKQVQAVSGGSSPEKSIECAFELMKAGEVAAKIPGGTGSCELLHFSQLTGYEQGNEYLEKTTEFEYYITGTFRQIVLHTLFTDVQIGDKFQFVFHKWNTDRFGIIFKEPELSIMLSFQDQSTGVALNDRIDNVYGVEEIPNSYPFSDFKQYEIVFEVLETHWKIYVDGVAFTTFNHRQKYDGIKKIQVKVGHTVTYLNKASDPKLPE